MDAPRIPRKDDPITADGQRRLVAAVLQAMRISGGPGILVKRHPAGITISAIPRRELATGTGAGTSGTSGAATEGDADPSGSEQKSIETADALLQLFDFDDPAAWELPAPDAEGFAAALAGAKMLVREEGTGAITLRYAPYPYVGPTEVIDVVVDVEFDSDTGTLIQHKRSVRVMVDTNYGATPTASDVMEFIECQFGEETV